MTDEERRDVIQAIRVTVCEALRAHAPSERWHREGWDDEACEVVEAVCTELVKGGE